MLVAARRRLLTALLQARKQPLQPSRDMRLVQFQAPHLAGPHLGLEAGNGGGVIDLNAFDPTLPETMVQFLEQGEATLSVARRALTAQLPVLPRSEVTLLAPVTRPDKVVCVGLNYVDHCKEQNVPVPKEPIIFSKFASSIVGPYDAVVLPPESQEVDWEVELAVVIGKKGKHIKATDAMAHVAGFTVAHDVSARDWQMRRNGKQWLLGKTFDTFCPLGPALVTKDSIAVRERQAPQLDLSQPLRTQSSTSHSRKDREHQRGGMATWASTPRAAEPCSTRAESSVKLNCSSCSAWVCRTATKKDTDVGWPGHYEGRSLQASIRSTQPKDLLPREWGAGPEQQHQPDGVQDRGADSLGLPVCHSVPRGYLPHRDPPRCRCVQEATGLSQEGG
ncbi:fumarylacetoacetate hydrolase domain-containing protein 2 isoform X1 [Sciurus carolinensis]|uniref:fumarylacetoacetate hydrolase domain-containing protein 2 isoform X1 n=1 Tax=Sciurus carolinensis TaxID=30640 RepID=UPI001FB30798|nr:fumarylacetoacetate hydrolase domain-containing protein 2 isoform X1 [Sciurus carolinensis]XP_047378740.1 fumarylacetoacetate hydrolase domain-containing protein 2 isoform X1 [Sciurus carolinensis]